MANLFTNRESLYGDAVERLEKTFVGKKVRFIKTGEHEQMPDPETCPIGSVWTIKEVTIAYNGPIMQTVEDDELAFVEEEIELADLWAEERERLQKFVGKQVRYVKNLDEENEPNDFCPLNSVWTVKDVEVVPYGIRLSVLENDGIHFVEGEIELV